VDEADRKSLFAALSYRSALDTISQIAGQLTSAHNRELFLSDPRRRELFEAIAGLNAKLTAEYGLSPKDSYDE
jgi:hypothetical protein